MKWYITFGQADTHRVNGKTFDCNCVAVINGPSAAQCDMWAFEWFNGKFHKHSSRLPPMEYYPRGLIEVNQELNEINNGNGSTDERA